MYLRARACRPVVVDVAYSCGSASAHTTRGSALVLLTHLRRATIVVGLALVTAPRERRPEVTGLTRAYRNVVDHLAFGVRAARTRVTLRFCG